MEYMCIECNRVFIGNSLTALYGHSFDTEECSIRNYNKQNKEKAMKHPLINEDSSSHYLMADGTEAIERLEQMYTEEELMSWAKITAMKYRLRIGRKDAPEKEVKKIRTYEDYHAYLVAKRDGLKTEFDGFTYEEKAVMDSRYE